MDVTIAICTWNRSNLLDATLARIRQLIVPGELSWEIVVVNNACTDNTEEVLAKYAATLPLRVIFEPRQGQSHARNTAAQAARGELILWTDDDVLVDPLWLTKMTEAAHQQPAYAFFGGPICPWFESQPPQWLVNNWRHFSSAYAIRNLGAEPLDFDRARLPYGANYAIRRRVQLQFPYNHSLGRVAHGEVRGEESDVLQRMLAANHQGRWVPDAKVDHFISRDRLTLDYLQRFYHGVGQMEVIRQAASESDSRRAVKSRWLLPRAQLLECWRHVLECLPGQRGKAWSKTVIRSCQLRGRLTGIQTKRNVPTDGLSPLHKAHAA